jgi:UPF0716 protein FxsA
MRRLGLLVALLIVASAIEITVVIAVGHAIGWGLTLLLLLATSVAGAYLLRREGGRAWQAFRADAAAGRPPGNAATDGVLVLAGGVFMLVPGFVSDAVGLLLLLPPTRHLVRAGVQRSVTHRMSPGTASQLFGPRRVRAHAGQPRPTPPGDYGPGPGQTGGSTTPTIEGEIIDPH